MDNKMFIALILMVIGTIMQAFSAGHNLGKSKITSERLYIEQQTQLFDCLAREVK